MIIWEARVCSTYILEAPSIDSVKVDILEFCATLERLYRCGMMSSEIVISTG